MAMLTLKQLKNIKINAGSTNKCGSSSCPIVVSLYDAISSFFQLNGINLITDSTLSGNGTTSSPLKIAQQGATSGQILTWNGTTWVPANPTSGTQSLTLDGSDITLSNGGGTIPVEDLISADTDNTLVAGTDGLLYVEIVSGLPSATTAGQIIYWTGLAYAVAAELIYNASPPNATTDVSLPHTPIASLPVKVFLNGVLQRNTLDYSISGNTITFSTTFANNARVTVFYYN